MDEPLKQVYVPVVATPGGEKTQLGVLSSEQDAWDVMRAFLSKAGETQVVTASIVAWEIDFVGEEGSFELATFDRKSCPVCTELSFWVEGEDERARCYYSRCGAWIEENRFEPGRWDCGWPSANWNKRSDSFESAHKGLVEMRAKSNSAGMSERMPSREAWLSEKDRERRTIQQKKFDSMSEDITE